MRRPPCLLAMLLASPAPVTAQEPPPVFTKEIVVTAERSEQPIDESTAAITLVSRDEIERAPAENLGELLALVPGFHVMSGADLGASGRHRGRLRDLDDELPRGWRGMTSILFISHSATCT